MFGIRSGEVRGLGLKDAVDQYGVVSRVLHWSMAVAFFVYATVITAQDVPMIDDSRSAAVFAGFTARIEEQNPEQALGWITAQYEQLVGVCEAPGSDA